MVRRSWLLPSLQTEVLVALGSVRACDVPCDAQWIAAHAVRAIPRGSLYTTLQRLEKRGAVKRSGAAQPSVYELTEFGQRILWAIDAADRVMTTTQNTPQPKPRGEGE